MQRIQKDEGGNRSLRGEKLGRLDEVPFDPIGLCHNALPVPKISGTGASGSNRSANRGGVAEFVRILPNVVCTPASEQNSDDFCYVQGDMVVYKSGWSSSDQTEREISMFKLRILLRRLPRVIPRMRAVWT